MLHVHVLPIHAYLIGVFFFCHLLSAASVGGGGEGTHATAAAAGCTHTGPTVFLAGLHFRLFEFEVI